MKYCNECGAELDDRAEFCDECGAKQESDEIGKEIHEINESELKLGEPVRAKEEERKGGKTAFVVITIFVIIVAFVVVVMLFFNKKEEKGAKASADSAAVTEEVIESVTPEPTEKSTEEPTPEPTEEQTPKPTDTPTPEPTEPPTPEPVQEPTIQPTSLVNYSYVQDTWINDDAIDDMWNVEIVSVNNNEATFAISRSPDYYEYEGEAYMPKAYRTGFMTSLIENGVMKFDCLDTTGAIQINGVMVFSTSDLGVAELTINTYDTELGYHTSDNKKMISSVIYNYTN